MQGSTGGISPRVKDEFLKDMLDRYPGVPFTLREIGDYAGLDHKAVHRVEQEAIKKIMNAVTSTGASKADILRALGGADG